MLEGSVARQITSIHGNEQTCGEEEEEQQQQSKERNGTDANAEGQFPSELRRFFFLLFFVSWPDVNGFHVRATS